MEAALVTGASTGIGRELALECAADGHEVVLVARNEARLRELAVLIENKYSVRAHVLALDLAASAAPSTIVEYLRSQSLGIDILVNNAGFGALDRFLDLDPDTQLRMITVNVTVPTALIRLLAPAMVTRKRGFILNVSSTAAFQPGPWMAVYCASKAYLLHLSEALANELEGSGVTVTSLCPGPTRTEFQTTARMGVGKPLRRPLMDAKEVARIGYRGMKQGKRIVIPGLVNRIATKAYRFAPRRFLTSAVRWIQEP